MKSITVATILLLALTVVPAVTQHDIAPVNDLPNPYQPGVRNWAMHPDGRAWGSTAGIDIGPKGEIWAIDRCGVNSCEGSNLATIHQIDPASGKVTRSIGAGLFAFPHGLHVDRDGNIWVTDGQASKDGTKGHQVLKLSPDGKVLMRLGKAGQKGGGPDMFDEPCDVITAPNGDIFVSDGHFGQQATATPATASRIVKFTRDGKFIKDFGKWGAGAGRAQDTARDDHRLARPADRGRSRQHADSDLRPRREAARLVAAVQPRQRSLHRPERDALSRSTRRARRTITRDGRKACASAA